MINAIECNRSITVWFCYKDTLLFLFVKGMSEKKNRLALDHSCEWKKQPKHTPSTTIRKQFLITAPEVFSLNLTAEGAAPDIPYQSHHFFPEKSIFLLGNGGGVSQRLPQQTDNPGHLPVCLQLCHSLTISPHPSQTMQQLFCRLKPGNTATLTT